MAPPRLDREKMQRGADAVAAHGTVSAAAVALRMPRSTLERWYRAALAEGLQPAAPGPAPASVPAAHAQAIETLPDRLLPRLRGRGATVAALAALAGVAPEAIDSALLDLEGVGFRLRRSGDLVALETAPPPPGSGDGPVELLTDDDGWITLGLTGDNHLGSKYERLDVAEALYDAFAAAGAAVALNAGNWIDGEARFNTHDLHTHGMDAQLRYLARHYPRRPGITTWAVAGDDHEGWYAQREGVDIGRYAARVMADAGREDWRDAGYMEAPFRLVHRASGQGCILSLTHPGGGSAYALSYSVQKIVESLDGGEKPAVLVCGHYHKLMGATVIRNVFCLQSGCTQDQTPFMRKRKLEAHVGGQIVRVQVDPATGAAVRCQSEVLRYFNRGYYAGRWSHHGGVRPIERVDAAGRPVYRVPAGRG